MHTEGLKTMKKKMVTTFLLLALMMFLGYFFVKNFITLEIINEQRDRLLAAVEDHYWLSVFVFIIAYIIVVISSFPLAALMTILSGFLFGVLWGIIFTNISATIGAILSFLIFRYFLGNAIQERYQERLVRFNENIQRYGARYLLTIHFLVIVPFFIINSLAALTKISLWTFMWTTAIGIIPSSIIYTYAGSKLSTITSINDIMSWPILLLFGCLVLFAMSSIFIDYMRRKKNVQS